MCAVYRVQSHHHSGKLCHHKGRTGPPPPSGRSSGVLCKWCSQKHLEDVRCWPATLLKSLCSSTKAGSTYYRNITHVIRHTSSHLRTCIHLHQSILSSSSPFTCDQVKAFTVYSSTDPTSPAGAERH